MRQKKQEKIKFNSIRVGNPYRHGYAQDRQNKVQMWFWTKEKGGRWPKTSKWRNVIHRKMKRSKWLSTIPSPYHHVVIFGVSSLPGVVSLNSFLAVEGRGEELELFQNLPGCDYFLTQNNLHAKVVHLVLPLTPTESMPWIMIKGMVLREWQSE